MDAKICQRCHQELPVELFAFEAKTVGRRKAWCKKCMAEYNKEYRKRRKANDGRKLSKEMPTVCSVPGCDIVLRRGAGDRNGMCWRHHRSMRPFPQCSVDGCDRLAQSFSPNAMCQMHSRRSRVFGSPGDAKPTEYTGKTTNSEGYVLVTCPQEYSSMSNSANYVLEHRLVMAQHLKRALIACEVVHHKNGDKTDNKIENLQLYIRGNGSHHAGWGDYYQQWQEALSRIAELESA